MTGWLLDTNILSELRRPRPEPKVLAFIKAKPDAGTISGDRRWRNGGVALIDITRLALPQADAGSRGSDDHRNALEIGRVRHQTIGGRRAKDRMSLPLPPLKISLFLCLTNVRQSRWPALRYRVHLRPS